MAEQGWTVETSHAHILAIIEANDKRYGQRFDAQNKALEYALDASSKAVMKAESTSEKRFEGVNEFRATLADQQRTLMPRSEVEAIFKGIDARLDALASTQAKFQAQRVGMSEGWGWAVGILGLAALAWAFLKGGS
jgi:hypothetical protein